MAALLGARPTEIYFVRGGTESDNLAILGRAQAARARGEVPRVAASAIEHSAVLDAMDAVVASGGESLVIGVGDEFTDSTIEETQTDGIKSCAAELSHNTLVHQAHCAGRALAHNAAHNLVPGRHRQTGRRRAAFNLIDFSVADTTGVDPDE